MQKIKATKKEILQRFSKILGCNNIDALLRYEEPFAYYARPAGWGCDFYVINNVCISAGYDYTGKEISAKLQKEYNNKAKNIIYNNELTNNQKKGYITKLLNNFIKKALDEGAEIDKKTKQFIKKYFTIKSETKTEIKGKTTFFNQTQFINFLINELKMDLMLWGYGGWLKNDDLKIIVSYAEGDFYIRAYATDSDYQKEHKKTEKFYKDNF